MAFYEISEQDVQTAAVECLGRKLEPDEIEKVKIAFELRIAWHETLCEAIHEAIQG